MQLEKMQIVGLIGAILALVGFFLPWMSALGINISALTLAGAAGTIAALSSVGMLYLLYLVPVFGIVGLVVTLVPLASKMKNMLLLISGILVLVADIYFITLPGVGAFLAYGFYLSLIGGIILLVAGLMGFLAKSATAPAAPAQPPAA
jgi:hypothetical protein